ncbi:MAG: hypothetical protein CME84_10115 [Henriciella sp.]|jgi:hypothetical protein|uniref:hypothetical protein n=1 Tax=Henriciella sp. TaxID=1968823 RepID=UPI000C120DA7|nr:hypothetical protein [Henriciella sp.]MAN74426.1 hypothetical protein [Henriciella sp.]MBF35189.1 hypothetical protein [Hyphomonadaceae bacterium]PHR75503.1 MAG: hypothetical protein COA64_11975 [Henriciella sp.]|tara:strand:- start:66 stop:722 length:657 start_codon:yes stop_codon:yes gene_type:complete
MLRTAFLVVSALTTGVSLGRKAITSAVNRRKQKIIHQAAIDARERIRGHADEYLRASLTGFVQSVFIKALLLILVWLGFRVGLYPHKVLSVITVPLLASFILRDMIVTFPTAKLVFTKLREYGWRPRKAVGETVAALVFEQVLAEAEAFETGRTTRIILSLSGHKMDDMTREIAEEVSAIARQTSWHDLRPFVLAAVAKFAVLSGLYSVFVFILVRTA